MTTLTPDQATADARRVIDAAGDEGLLRADANDEFTITSEWWAEGEIRTEVRCPASDGERVARLLGDLPLVLMTFQGPGLVHVFRCEGWPMCPLDDDCEPQEPESRPVISAETLAEIDRVSREWPDGIHTCAELQALEPGRRPCTCGRCPQR